MNSSQPIYQSIFGTHWHALPAVIKHHYANPPFCHEANLAKGMLTVKMNRIARLITPLFRLFGALVPYQGESVPVTVCFRSEPKSNALRFERTFHFSNRKVAIFNSRMQPLCDNQLIEYFRFGVGWKHRCYFDGEKVIFQHLGYVWTVAGRSIPIPLSLLIGKAYAEETPLPNHAFALRVVLIHPLFGRLYEYHGQLEMTHE